MDFATTTIDSIDRAKEYFQAMGCSSFHMGREYSDRYDEYRSLTIPTEMEREWTCEEVTHAFAKLKNRKTKLSDLWHIHSGMERLVQQLKTVDSLRQIYEATETIVPCLPKRSKVLVAETIIGRSHLKYRSGLVFLAYDLNQRAISQHFAKIAAELARSSGDLGAETVRSQAALDACDEIKTMLGFT